MNYFCLSSLASLSQSIGHQKPPPFFYSSSSLFLSFYCRRCFYCYCVMTICFCCSFNLILGPDLCVVQTPLVERHFQAWSSGEPVTTRGCRSASRPNLTSLAASTTGAKTNAHEVNQQTKHQHTAMARWWPCVGFFRLRFILVLLLLFFVSFFLFCCSAASLHFIPLYQQNLLTLNAAVCF